MNPTSSKLPVYLQFSQITMGLLAFFYILYIGQGIIIPFLLATIVAILLNPIVNFLMSKNVNKILAIVLAILTAAIIIGGVMFFIGSQLVMFSDSAPQFKQKFDEFAQNAINWISQTFNQSKPKIQQAIENIKSQGMKNGTAVITTTLGAMSNIFTLFVLMPVYIFLILFYKPLLLEFVALLFHGDKKKIAEEVLFETKTLIQSYLIGLLIEAVIVATLISAGLLIMGIQYAILMGIIAALLNLIPYIGNMIAMVFPITMALTTKEPSYVIWVIALFSVVQFVDNNLIVPNIVASKVKVNALVSIIVVLIGGALWGIAGMFLSIPLTAILKVIFDRIDDLKPLGFLIGDNQPRVGKVAFNFKGLEKRAKKKEGK
ncbi:AI-2E family transporter [Emticicia sp. BO119]|uniref:AI-2E family transporter n=1 Tax=Emticicia sp. BO119 TaxID=2757768 RepID=UPI0015F103D1|nr:AI-2E family transporter [Emticicia sp. BO119]MBA4852357.1 AI-2E family transporter [Emticicia sp. BO119]